MPDFRTGNGEGDNFENWSRLLTFHKNVFYLISDQIVNEHTDHGANCGGVQYQIQNDYKCGLCGDPVGHPEPRAHEDGGKWGKGIIAGKYVAGESAVFSIQIRVSEVRSDYLRSFQS